MSLQMDELKTQMTDVQLKLDNVLQTNGASGSTSSPRVEIQKCSSTQELLNLENELAVEDTQKNAELHLSLLGGTSPLNRVKRILEMLITNDLAHLCNWSGKHGKFPLKNLINLWKTV
uniref:DUF4806 domain-containing protein n=1 Tax=Cacopsylla melanoneura TaxID=428564 RepID=A0A8D9FF00_9HEMI